MENTDERNRSKLSLYQVLSLALSSLTFLLGLATFIERHHKK